MMRLSIDAATLAPAVAWAARRVPAKPAVPAAAALRLAADEALRIDGTDLADLWCRATVGAVVSEPGAALVSARLLDQVTAVTSGRVGLTVADTRLVMVDQAGGRWTLPLAADPDEFPTPPGHGQPAGQALSASVRAALGRVLVATSDASTAPTHGAVEAELGAALTLAATDRYRVAVAAVDWDPAPGLVARSLIVPGAVLAAAAEALADQPTVRISASGNTVGLATDTRRVIGRLHAIYAPWRRVVPDPDHLSHATLIADTDELVAAIKRSSVLLADSAVGAVRLHTTDDGLELSAHGKQAGDPADSVALDLAARHGEHIDVAVRARWLRDAVAALGSPQAALNFPASPTRPFLLRPAARGQPLPGYTHTLIPLGRRVAEEAA